MKYFMLLLMLIPFLSRAQTSHELTLYFVPSPYGMDWSTPKNIMMSAIKNHLSFQKRSIGHVFVEIKCDEVHELTGMSAKNFDPLYQLLMERRGLGLLYHSFDGELEAKEKVQLELTSYLQSGRANFARFLLNKKQCQRITTYLNEFREKNIGRHYGLVHRPRFGEGSGCSAFAVSFPEILDIMDLDMRTAWSRGIRIPIELTGPPLRDEGVGIFKLLWNGSSWASDKDKSHILNFWSPDKMHRWVEEKVKLGNSPYPTLKIEKASGLVIDRRSYPTPEGPIWLQHTDPSYQTKLEAKR